MIDRLLLLGAMVLAGTAAAARPTAAQEAPPDFSLTEAHFLATLDDEDTRYWVITLQHFSTWKYGSNFFFVDAAGGPDLDFYDELVGLYLEYAPVVSLGRTGVLPVGGGRVLQDVGVTAQINAGFTPDGIRINRVFLEGVELAWRVPGFAVFNTQLLARQEEAYDASAQFTWVYAAPFAVGGVNGLVQGFLDVWGREVEGVPNSESTVVLAQPQLLFNVGGEEGRSDLQVGVELEVAHDFPVAAVSPGWDLAISPMVRWVF